MEFSETTLDLFKRRGINPGVALKHGVRETDEGLEFPGGRVRNLNGNGPKMRQPSGVPVQPWLPEGAPEPGDAVLVCEGETDALAALTALEFAPDAPFDKPKVISLPGSSFPAERLARGLAQCIVYLAYDADKAGREASARAVRALREVGAEVVVLEQEEDYDLADTLTRAGSEVEAGACLMRMLADADTVDPWEEVESEHGEVLSGKTFLTTEDDEYEVLWGEEPHILMAAGEPLLICGGDGTGKTTIGQQVALARAGVQIGNILGYPVRPDTKGKVLYVAADRPKQAKRSLRRMVRPEDYEVLQERFIVLKGGGFNIGALTKVAREVGATSVFVDTLGASVDGDLGSNDIGMQVYHSLQEAAAAGIEVVLLHHDRKGEGEGGWQGIREVYGSRWITAACGSVVMLRGKPGSSEVWLRHVKQPDQAVGPAQVHHDASNGRSYLDGVV
jgi:hypothetical protein